MMITTLFVSACLVSNSLVCKDVPLINSAVDDTLTEVTCDLGPKAQIMALQWAQQNPAWDVKRLQCVYEKHKERAA